MNLNHLPRIYELAGVPEAHVQAVYMYGSRVYGTHSPQSDHDYIVILDDEVGAHKDAQQYDSHSGDLSIHTYLYSSWKEHLANHKIFAIECYSQFPMDHKAEFKLDLPTLRKEISSKSSNSWVKCKKKLTVETGEFYVGIKSLFHSFRIPFFGIQIAQHGKVVDFSAANYIWDELKNLPEYTTWEELNAKYKPLHNALMTEFRTHAEKV